MSACAQIPVSLSRDAPAEALYHFPLSDPLFVAEPATSFVPFVVHSMPLLNPP